MKGGIKLYYYIEAKLCPWSLILREAVSFILELNLLRLKILISLASPWFSSASLCSEDIDDELLAAVICWCPEAAKLVSGDVGDVKLRAWMLKMPL